MTYTSKFKENTIYFIEANIYPEEYLSSISKKIDKVNLSKYSKINPVKICKKLSELFFFNHIEFIYQPKIIAGNEDYIQYGINSGATLPNRKARIGIFINPRIVNIAGSRDFEIEFKKWLLLIIKHELIHRGQNLRIKDLKLRSMVMQKDYKTHIDYLSDKHEIMARAWEIVELFKLIGYGTERIKSMLKSNDIEKMQNYTLRVYHDWFNMDSDVLKLLYKYMYGYL